MIEFTPIYGPLTKEQADADFESLAHVKYVEDSTAYKELEIEELQFQNEAFDNYLSDDPDLVRAGAGQLYQTNLPKAKFEKDESAEYQATIPESIEALSERRDRIAKWATLLFSSRDLKFKYDPRSEYVARTILKTEPLPPTTPYTLTGLAESITLEDEDTAKDSLKINFLKSIAEGKDLVSSELPAATEEEYTYINKAASFEEQNGPLSKMYVEELALSVSAYNRIKRAGMKTVDQVISMSAEDLLAIPKFGRKSLSETQEVLAEKGLSLRP